MSIAGGAFHVDGHNTEIIRLTDVSGRNVVTLKWDGKDNQGNVLQSGDYFIIAKVTPAGGSQYSLSQTVDMVVDKINLFSGLVGVFPNPASSRAVVIIQTTEPGVVFDIRVWNMAGELVKEMSLDSGSTQRLSWNLDSSSGSDLTDGAYVVEFSGRDQATGQVDRKTFKFAILRNQ